MPRLYVLSGPDVGRSYAIEDGSLLGRARDCDAALRGPSVSRHHARIERDGAGWKVVDLGSRNGTFVYGKRVEEAPLADYGAFRIGKLELRFRLEERESAAAPPPKPGAPPAPPRREPTPEEEVVLEEVVDVGSGQPVPAAVGPAAMARTQPVRPVRGGSSFLQGDLGQRSGGMQALLVAGVIALALAVAWGTFALVTYMRAS